MSTRVEVHFMVEVVPMFGTLSPQLEMVEIEILPVHLVTQETLLEMLPHFMVTHLPNNQKT